MKAIKKKFQIKKFQMTLRAQLGQIHGLNDSKHFYTLDQYESCCFITNVREKSEECGGLVRLREEFLSRVLEQENLRIDTPRMGSTLIKERIRHKGF